MLGKRGQFYLIAALVIVSLATGFILITNKVSVVQNPNIGYLKNEVEIESSKVINYGIYNEMSNSKIEGMLANLSYYYINNTPTSNLYFLIGNKTQQTFIAYQKYGESVYFNKGSSALSIKQGITYNNVFNLNPAQDSIGIKINDTSYNFSLNTGENFHFAIESLSGGQDYIISN